MSNGQNRTERRQQDAAMRGPLRRAVAEQRERRVSGIWPEWISRTLRRGETGGELWARDFHTAFKNGVYAVLVRTIETDWGTIEHAMITTLQGDEIPWRDKQRIKNELFGPDRTALEVMPPIRELIDGANAYHIWVLPAGMRLPFTIGPRFEP